MTDTQELAAAAATMQRALEHVAEYLGLPRLPADASVEGWALQADQVRRELESPTNLVARLHKSAQYVAEVESQWADSRADERASKASFMAALVQAVQPALPAISAPLVRGRTFAERSRNDSRSYARETRDLFTTRGVVLLDGWRRDVTDGDAGKSLALLENSDLVILKHRGLNMRSDMGDVSHHVSTTMEAVSIADSLKVFNRKAFLTAVNKIVETVWDLARSATRKQQIRESHRLADKLAAIRTLLEAS